jgi:signal transduction histidine kinase
MSRRPRWTLRLRLTALYTGVFAAAGAALLVATFLLVKATLPSQPPVSKSKLPSVLAEACKQLGPFSSPSLESKCKRAYTAGSVQGQQDALHSLQVYGTLGLVVAIAVVAVVGWLVAGRVLRPLQDITATARQLSAHDLQERIRLDGPDDELKELADTFDAMLERLDAAFVAQTRFVANASHELRTPLTIMRTELDVTLSSPDNGPDDYARMAGVLRDAIARSERLINALLTLAHSDQGLVSDERVDLGALMHDEVAQRLRAAGERGIVVKAETPETEVHGDRLLLEQLAGNLVDNAIRHNVDGGWVRVTVGRDDGRGAVIAVANSSRPIDPREVESIFEPFRRLDGERSGAAGHGLGLSIVRSVAVAHHGDVRASVENGGLRVEVRLPA